jgi:hypothetical protein
MLIPHVTMHDYDSKVQAHCTRTTDEIPISALHPRLPELNSKRFKATVVLIWPYSPSASQFALLLADPDLRSRHKQGHVRVRFLGSSAKAVAATGVTIGDDMVISLQGATFTKQAMNKTLGENIDWELSYTHTVVLQALRNSDPLANLDIVQTAQVSALTSRTSQDIVAIPKYTTQRPIPIFLEGRRVSYEYWLETNNNPLACEDDHTHSQNRQKKVYRQAHALIDKPMSSEDGVVRDKFGRSLEEKEEQGIQAGQIVELSSLSGPSDG